MDTLAKKGFLALGGTLLSYSGNSETLNIPAVLGEQPIRAIGKGALAESAALKRVLIPREIRQVGDRAFARCEDLEFVEFAAALPILGESLFEYCPRLKEIALPRLPLNEEELWLLRENSCRLQDGSLVPERLPDCAGLYQMQRALEIRPFRFLPKTAGSVFQDRDDSPRMHTEDARSFQGLIRLGKETPMIREAEAANDLFARRDAFPEIKPVALLCLYDREITREKNAFLLRARILFGRFYWQSKVKILYERQTYYLYQRHYLTGEGSVDYIRRYICVFSEDGPLRDERRAREIYAKYQLSSIL